MCQSMLLDFILYSCFVAYCNSFPSPVEPCPANETSSYYVADTVDPCSFYWCVRGAHVGQRSFKCAPGSGTPSGYAGYHNPCTERNTACEKKKDTSETESTEVTTENEVEVPTLSLYYTYYYFYYLPAIVPSITYVAHNYYVPGGQLVVGISDVYTCVRACSSDMYCKGVDFDKEKRKCWFHLTGTVCRSTILTKSFLHFRMYNCDVDDQVNEQDEHDESETDSTEDATTTTTTMIPPADDRDLEPVSFVGRHILGGKIRTEFETLLSCLEGCRADRACSGFDYDGKWDTCWFHGVMTECQLLQYKETCVHFRLRECILRG